MSTTTTEVTGHRPQETAATPQPGAAALPKPAREVDRGEYELLNPTLIVPSPTNPRKTYNAEADREFLENIRLHGVKEPVLVRPTVLKPPHLQALKQRSMATVMKVGMECYELIAGERRWMATLRSNRPSIRAIVENMDDEAAMELQVIENDQREDIDPIDRAISYRNLMEKHKADHKGETTNGKPDDYINYLADRLGRKRRTVYQIMTLADLGPEGQQALRSEKMSPSHAYEVARYTPEVQKGILHWANHQYKFPSVRELKQHIKTDVQRLLDAAPWKKDDAKLVPAAGACSNCPKNTAVNRDLDPEEGNPKCTDPPCYDGKMSAHLVQIETALKDVGEKAVRIATEWNSRPTQNNQFLTEQEYRFAKKGSCKHVVTGVVIDGNQAGDKKLVCATKKCEVHWHSWERQSYGYSSGRQRSTSSSTDLRKKIRENKLNKAIREAQTPVFINAVKKLGQPDLHAVAALLLDRMDHRVKHCVGTAFGMKDHLNEEKQIQAMSPEKLSAFLAVMVCAEELLPEVPDWLQSRGTDQLDEFDKRHKIGLEKVRQKATAELKAKFADIDRRRKEKEQKEKKAKVQTSAKGKKKTKGAAA